MDMKIEFNDTDDNSPIVPPNSIGAWSIKNDTSVLISDPQPSGSHRKIIRRWNRLSRLQRSIVYALFVIAGTVLVMFYVSKVSAANVNKINHSDLAQETLKNLSLVNEQVAEATVSKKTVVNDEKAERPMFTGPINARQYAVVESFKHAWRGYKEHAWGHDNLKPVSGMAFDWFSLGLTIVDSLDTAYIMGLTDEFEEGKQWIQNELVFTKNKDVNFFEVTIRVLGGLLSCYHFTQDRMFLTKAIDLGDRLMAAFSSPSGIPYSDVNLGERTAHAPEWSHYSTTAEVTTVQLEFRELSRASNNPGFEDAAAAVSEKIHHLPKKHGLVPIFINPNTGHFLPHATITLGARGDSYYEYLLKQWLQTGKTINYLLDDYLTAIEGVRNFLAKRSSPNKHLFIGELSAGSEGTWFIELYQKYRPSPYVGIWIFWRRGLVINDPDLSRKILVKDADTFRNRMLASGKSDPMGALNLFTVDDPLWTSLRRRLTSVFTGSKLRGWQELYQAKVDDLIYRINSDNEKGIVSELKSLFADYATDIIGESSFGIQCQSTRNSTGPLRMMTKEFEKYNQWRGMAWSSIFFLPEMVDILRFSFWPKNTVTYFRKIFKVMVEERGGFEKDIDGKRDLLDALLKMKIDAQKENQEMDIDILISNAMIFLQGGYDTSSSALTYAVYELAYNREYQRILYDELVEAEKALNGKRFDAESLAKLPYLDAVIKETMRKYPIMGWLDRKALRDYQVNENLTIPANTVVYINAIGMHWDPKYFPNPEEFRPDRFLPENANNIVPYSYLPFGEGPRMCIGKRIGMNTVRYALAAVVLNFEIFPLAKLPQPNDIPIETKGLFYHPAIPLSVEFKRRK